MPNIFWPNNFMVFVYWNPAWPRDRSIDRDKWKTAAAKYLLDKVGFSAVKPFFERYNKHAGTTVYRLIFDIIITRFSIITFVILKIPFSRVLGNAKYKTSAQNNFEY